MYIPTAPVLPAPKVIFPSLYPELVSVPLTYIPIPAVPIFKAPFEVIFIFSLYTAVPLSKSDISIFTFISLEVFPSPL